MSNVFQRFSLAIPLALAVGVPYVLTSESTESVRGTVGSWFTGSADEVTPVEGITDPEVGRTLALTQRSTAVKPQQPATATPRVTLEGVLRFDITPRWVMENWPQVSTTRAEDQLDGLRVPLVTGTQPQDVAGSLTYYFDKQRVVQRIALDGVVGDDRHLVTVVTRTFHLEPEPQAGVGVFVTKWNGQATSALWIRRAPVVSVNNPYSKFEFAMELNRPNHYFGLSPLFRARLENAQANMDVSSTMR
jgi:hypothetical protein